jgi:hypothetical protein
MTYRIIYSSVSSTPMQLEELEDLLEQAQGNNSRNGITGALVYVDGFFLQVLEGEKDSVQELMQTISKDFRHETVTVLQAGEIAAAAFSGWDMAYVSATPEQVAQWAGLSGTTRLPQVWDDIHQDPHRATQVAKSILAVLVGGPSLQTEAS